MNMLKKIIALLSITCAIVACEKETSIDGNGNINFATGSLLDSAGNCQNIAVNGKYGKDTVLTAFHNVVAQVTFTTTGNFVIYTDTVNGIYFYAKGYAYTVGTQPITISGFGKCFADTTATYTLHLANSTCSFTIKKYVQPLNNGTNNDYFPTTNFSHWTYNNTLINDTATVSVLGTDKTIAGSLFRQFLFTIPKFSMQDTLYYRKDGFGNYYRYDTVGSGTKTEFAFLKDYAIVGDTWESPIVPATYQSTTTTAKYVFTLKRKNVTRVINGNSFDSVIIVQAETQYLINGNYDTQNSIDYYYAKKVGLINIDQTGPSVTYTSPIKTWVVN